MKTELAKNEKLLFVTSIVYVTHMLSGTKLPVDNKVSLHVSVEYRDEISFIKKNVFLCVHIKIKTF